MERKVKEPVRLRRKKINGGNESLYLDIYWKGGRQYDFLRLYLIPEKTKADKDKNRQTLALANAIKAQRTVELQNGKFGFHATPNISVMEYFDIVKRDDHVWESAGMYLKRYCGSAMLSDIDMRFCEGFKSFLAVEVSRKHDEDGRHLPLGKSSQSAYFAKFRAFIRKAYNDGAISDDYCRGVGGVKHDPAKREYLTIEELRRIAGASCRHDVNKRAFLFSCFTGLRFSDVKKLTWGEVSDGEFTRLTFRQKKTGGMEYLDINEQAARVMGDRGDDEELVFVGLRRGEYLQNDIDRMCKSAGITKHITFHCARHTFATMMLTLGTDLYTTSKLLGHSDVKTTQIYAKIVDEKKRDAVAGIPKIL